MVRIATLWRMVLAGACILLGGCGGHERDAPIPPKPAVPTTPLPTAQAGNNEAAPGSKRALHHQGAAYRREQASHKNMAQ